MNAYRQQFVFFKGSILNEKNVDLNLLGDKIVTVSEMFPLNCSDINFDGIKLSILDDHKLKFLAKLNPKNLRIYSRKMRWIFELLHQFDLKSHIENKDPFKIGIYVSGNGYVTPWEVIQGSIDGLSYEDSIRQFFNPKHSFKHNIGIVPAHISIHFGIKGPTNAFFGYPYAGNGALEKAKFDLEMGYVETAIILIFNVFEDNVQIAFQRYYNPFKSNVFQEGVRLVILDQENRNYVLPEIAEKEKYSLGFLSPLYLGRYL